MASLHSSEHREAAETVRQGPGPGKAPEQISKAAASQV